ncbi:MULTISPECIES: AI-2E family transporter [Gammaproteobacteria]|uniref:AI-2E family transporter n=1 Tax=Gammaproteobacteria TaxID=1236 RepID=UPI000DD03B5F|nr:MULTISPECIES: AI-2E family transporter [Gammaproteobacteria]RTE85883.1 AI-2E family transporter [Aliidiomarina sp. B3213]TCZ90116.1 AI-2E family transporter [Lysobacter sp. N42]
MRENLERRSFMLLLAAVSVLFIWILVPFWSAIFWAVAMAVIFFPLKNAIQKKLGDRPNLSAGLTLLVAVVIVIIPILLISGSFVKEGIRLYEAINAGDIDPQQVITRIREAFPIIQTLFEKLDIDMNSLRERFSQFAVNSSQFIARSSVNFGTGTFNFIVNLAIMLYLTFFFLRDGSKLTDLMVDALPFGKGREKTLFNKFAEVTRATVKGNIIVAIAQGALGGIIFWILGIQAVIIWAVIMAILSLIPAVGAALVWFPFAIYLFAIGDWISASILIAYGAIIIGLADNVLRPILVGRDTKLPDYVVLLSTLGGISLMGVNGFVLGPLIAALFLVCWQIFAKDLQND